MDLIEFVFVVWAIFMAFLSFVPLVEYTVFYLADRRSTKQHIAQKHPGKNVSQEQDPSAAEA